MRDFCSCQTCAWQAHQLLLFNLYVVCHTTVHNVNLELFLTRRKQLAFKSTLE